MRTNNNATERINQKNLQTIANKLCCLTSGSDSSKCNCDCEGLSVSIDPSDLQPIIDAINNLIIEIDNNLACSISKACDLDTCDVIVCATCFDVEGQPVSDLVKVDGTWIDAADYTGTLDLGCTSCGDPIPTYEIINKDVCFTDCTQGCQIFKINTLTNEITLVATLDQQGQPTTLEVAPCPKFEIVETKICN